MDTARPCTELPCCRWTRHNHREVVHRDTISAMNRVTGNHTAMHPSGVARIHRKGAADMTDDVRVEGSTWKDDILHKSMSDDNRTDADRWVMQRSPIVYSLN